MQNAPRIFRTVLEVANLENAKAWYERLLAIQGRHVGGQRVYFDCGPVIVALLEAGRPPQAAPNDLYFEVDDLAAYHARATELRCLSTEMIHGESGGEMRRRPWGEHSFYVQDPDGNGLCFVESGTLFTGRPD